MLSPDNREDIRRHLGYGTLAVVRYNDGINNHSAYRTNESLQTVETILDNLTSVAEAKLSGKCMGNIALVGLDPVAGNTVSITFTSEVLDDPITISSTVGANTSKYLLAAILASMISSNALLAAAQITVAGPFKSLNDLADPNLEICCPDPFTLTTSYTGLTSLSVISQGVRLEPSAIVGSRRGVPVVKYGYLPILNHLSSAIAGVTRNADMSRAGTYSRGRELKERREILDFWRTDLSNYLQIPRRNKRAGGFVI